MKNSNQPAAGGRKFGGAKFGTGKPGGKFGKPFGKPHGGSGRPFGKPGGGFGDGGDKPAGKFGGPKSFGGPKAFGKPGGRPFGKPGGDRPFGGNAGGDRPFDKPESNGEFGQRENERTFGGERSFGKREGGRPFGKPGGRPFGNHGNGTFGNNGAKSRPFGEPGGGRPFGKPGGGRPFGKPEGGRRFGKPGGRPFGGDPRPPFGERREFGDRDERGHDEGGAFGSGVHAPRPRFGRESFEGGRPTGKPGRFNAGRRGLRVDDGFDEPLARGEDDNDGSEGTEQRRNGRVRNGMLDFDDLIYGIHAVEEALKAGEKLRTLHVGRGRNEDPLVARLVDVARELGVTIRVEDPAFFARIPYKAHQSVVAVGAPFDYVSLEDAINVRPAGHRLIVVLDHLTDPHNVGAILRTAECSGAQAVLLPDRRSAGINATVRKTSAGATSHLPIAKVGNLSQVIRELKDQGFTVFGADMADDAVLYTEADFKGDIVLVIGGEGDGLARLVARSCDSIVKIPLSGTVSSLNASVAAGILLYEVVRQRTQAV